MPGPDMDGKKGKGQRSSSDRLSARQASMLSKAPTPLPTYQIYCVVFIQVCEAVNVNVLFPFMAFMVEDMGYTGSQLGYHTGALAASFCAAQFCTSVPWGMVSDRFGRRPAVIAGTLGAAMGMFIFGSAKTYPQAVAGRVIGGLLNGNIGVVKSFLTEITDNSNRGAGFSLMSLAWSIGVIVAPLAGGLLSNPADKYPAVFSQSGLFGEYPYLLPCLLCVCWNVVAAAWCFFVMVETRVVSSHSASTDTSSGGAREHAVVSGEDVTGVELSSVGAQQRPATGTVGKSLLAISQLGNKMLEQQRYAKLANSSIHGSSSMHGSSSQHGGASFGGDSSEHCGGSPNPLWARIDSGGSSGSCDVLDTAYDTELERRIYGDSAEVAIESADDGGILHRGGSSAAQALPYETVNPLLNTESRLAVSERQETTGAPSQMRDKAGPASGGMGVGSREGREGCDVSADDVNLEIDPPHSEPEEILPAFSPPSEEVNGGHNYVSSSTVIHCHSGNYDDDDDHGDEELGYSRNPQVETAEKPDREQGDNGGDDDDDDDDDDDPGYLCFSSCLGGPATIAEAEAATAVASASNAVQGDEPTKGASAGLVLRQRTVLLATLNYGILAMAQITLDETLPLFLKHDIDEGGLSFDSGEIGTLLSISGGMMLLFTYFALPYFSRYSKFWLFEVGSLCAIPVALFWPFFALLYRGLLPHLHSQAARLLALWPCIVLINTFKSFAACFAFTAVMIQVNHSVTAGYLGAVNGMGQSFAALARGVGPALGGVLWSLGSTHHFVFLNFIAVAVLYMGCLCLNRQLPRSLDFEKKVRDSGRA